MKNWKLVFVLSLVGMTALAEEGPDPIAEKYALNGYAEFRELSKEEAIKKGEALAKSDYAKGIYRILVFGLRAGVQGTAETDLRKQYRVYIVPIAGCIVDDGILGGADGYNRIMKQELQKLYGRNIFEAWEK